MNLRFPALVLSAALLSAAGLHAGAASDASTAAPATGNDVSKDENNKRQTATDAKNAGAKPMPANSRAAGSSNDVSKDENNKRQTGGDAKNAARGTAKPVSRKGQPMQKNDGRVEGSREESNAPPAAK